MNEDEQRARDDEEPLPRLPLDRGMTFGARRWWIIAIVAVAVGALRLLMGAVRDDQEARHPRGTTMLIEDPGAGLSPDQREELDEAIRTGRPLQLDAEGRLRPAE